MTEKGIKDYFMGKKIINVQTTTLKDNAFLVRLTLENHYHLNLHFGQDFFTRGMEVNKELLENDLKEILGEAEKPKFCKDKDSEVVMAEENKTESDFGKGFVYNLILFSKHFENAMIERLHQFDIVMKMPQEKRDKVLVDNPDSSHNYGWNKEVKWWYEKIVPAWGSPERAFSADLTTWANGATDHLLELEIPEKWRNHPIGEKAQWLRDFGLKIGHEFREEALYTFDDFLKMLDTTKEISLLIDKELGIEPIKGKWE